MDGVGEGNAKGFFATIYKLRIHCETNGTGNALSFVLASGDHTMFVNEIEERS